MVKTHVPFALAAVSLLFSLQSQAGEPANTDSGTTAVAADAAAGEALYRKTCKNCHGPTAKGMASFPALAGQPADYLITRLMQYRAGETIGPNTPLMMPQATGLSDQAMADLAAYIATLEE